jgi:hypothetical protein
MTITDTPRTDAARERYFDGKTSDWVHYTTCGMIEQELAAYKNEALCLRDDHDLLYRDYQKLEAEVERLKAQLSLSSPSSL